MERRSRPVSSFAEDSREGLGAHPPRRSGMHSHLQVTTGGFCVRYFEEPTAAAILTGSMHSVRTTLLEFNPSVYEV